ncbi:MAG: glycosyltransferase 87 family protein [Bdellovibrionales bacterium]
MTPILADLRRDPWVWAGLVLKLALIAFVVPLTQTNWFYPFIANTLAHPDINVWQSYLDYAPSEAPPFPFPYGPAMALVFLPLSAAGQGIDGIFQTHYFMGLGFDLTLLLADLAAFLLLLKLWPNLRRELVWFFWLSPLAIYVTYWHGQLDIVPVALLLGVFFYLKNARALRAGITLALAIAAKLSMVAALPLTLIYLWRNRRLHYLRHAYVSAFAVAALVFIVPFLFMPGFQDMVLANPEMSRLYELALPVGNRAAIYLAPLLYMLALYALWRMPRISFDLLFAAAGLVFFVLIVSTAAPAGWYLWLLPFLAWRQARARIESRMLIYLFSLTVIGGHMALSTGVLTPWGVIDGPSLLQNANIRISLHQHALWQTAITILGCILMWGMQRDTIRQNDYFRLSRHPLAIAIAGDSGSGKDDFAHRLIDLFGAHSVSHLSGDNYHLWDRDGPMWKNLTHLNPRANDLQYFTEDVRALVERRSILVRHYDHALGRYVAPVRMASNDIVIASGLHALYDDRLRPRLAVRIYLDTDDALRRFWKTRRDVNERGYEAKKVEETLKRRKEDSKTYIQPQKDHADLIFSLQPVHPDRLNGDADPHCKLHVVTRQGLYHERLALLLVGLCGLHVQMSPSPDLREVEWDIKGDVSAEDIAFAAQKLLPHFAEMLDNRPRWSGGMQGVMQLFALAHIDSNLRNQMS